MTRGEFAKIEAYMLGCMRDSAHDPEHVYRVLYTAMDIAASEAGVDNDILIAACLLHDVGRLDETRGLTDDHAAAGAKHAHDYLTGEGYSEAFAAAVRDCVAAHRYRGSVPPSTIEAKILFDSDKLDVTGMMGVARTLLFGANHSRPLYELTPEGRVSDGRADITKTFFKEYRFKLEGIYSRFYTSRAREIAETRRESARRACEALLAEADFPYERGKPLLDGIIGGAT